MTIVKTALQIKTIGSILKEKRKEKKLELKQVSDIIKIRVDYLQALEDGNYTRFPSEVYLKGFLKNYAKFLGVNTEKALAMYRRENERKQSEATINLVAKSKPKKVIFNLTPNRIVALIAGLAIIMIVIYLASYVGKVVRTPELKMSSPIALDAQTEGTFKTDANFIDISGSAEIGSKLTINDQELKLNNFEQFNKQFNLETGENKFIIKAESQFGRNKVLTLIVSKSDTPIPTSVTPTPTPLAMQISIEISKKDANLLVMIDGEKRTDRLYKIGSTLDFNANRSISLTTNQPASLTVKINGNSQTLTGNTSTWAIENQQVVKK